MVRLGMLILFCRAGDQLRNEWSMHVQFVGGGPSGTASVNRALNSFQIVLRGTGQDFAGGLETRTVAGTIPGLLRLIPGDDAFEMRANRGAERDFSLVVAVGG